MPILPQNYSILKKRFPKLLKRIECASETGIPYKIKGSGVEAQMVALAGKHEVMPFGNLDQTQLAQRWAEAVECKENGLYAICGFGLGKHLQLLLNRVPEDNIYFFVCDESPGWLKAVFSKVDCSRLLSDPRVMLGAGEPDDELFEPLGELHLALLRDAAPVLFSPIYTFEAPYYDECLTAFARFVDFAQKLHKTNIADSSVWQERTLENLPYTIDAPDIKLMEGMFKGLPLILIAAGPSLDESIDFLKAAKEKALLVCVNSAYRKLANSGILPHITIAADPREDTYKGYMGCPTEGVYLVSSTFVHSGVVKLFAGRNFTWAGANSLIRLLRKRVGLPEGSSIIEQGTISACVPDFARVWGTNKICLVGQDMAVTSTGQSHTADSFYADEGRLRVHLDKCRMLPGNTFTQVPVEEKLYVYLKTFEQLIHAPDYQNLEFINTARTGVKIQGAPYKTYQEALAWLGQGSTANVSNRLQAIFDNRPKMNTSYEEAVDAFRCFVQSVLEIAWDGAVYSSLLPAKFENMSYKDNPKLLKCDDFSRKLNNLLDRYPQDTEVLLDGKTKFELYRYLEACQKINSPAEHWSRIQKNKEYFWAIAEGANFMRDRIETYLV